MRIIYDLGEVLKSGIFWAAVQAITAVVGIIFLVLYTRYTRKMMQIQVEVRRGEIAPIFTLVSLGGSENRPRAFQADGQESTRNRNLHLRVRNIGRGPALRFRGWHGRVDPAFKLRDSRIITRGPSEDDGVTTSFEVLAGESAEMVCQWVDTSSHWLCILECEDTAGNIHQFQLIRIPVPAAIDPWQMVHGWTFKKSRHPSSGRT